MDIRIVIMRSEPDDMAMLTRHNKIQVRSASYFVLEHILNSSKER